MDKKELPIWIKAIGSIGLIIDAFAVWVLILYLLNEYCEHFLKALLCILCGFFYACRIYIFSVAYCAKI